MTTLERCPHPHSWPAVECENVQLTRSRFARVCLCGHPKAVHEHWRTALDCGVCDCLHYETARSRRGARAVSYAAAAGIALFVAAFWGAVGAGIVWPLIRAIGGR